MSDFADPRFKNTSDNPNSSDTQRAMEIIRNRKTIQGVGDRTSPVGEQGAPSEDPPPSPPAAETQAPEPEAPPRQEPPKKDEGEGEQRVPLKRLNDVIKQRDTAAEDAAKAREEIAALQKEVAEAKRKEQFDALRSGKDRPKGWEDMAADQQSLWLLEKFSEYQQEAPPSQPTENAESAEWIAKLKIMESGGFNFQQAGAIGKIQAKNPNLSMDQAVTLARSENADLFGEEGSSEGSPSVPASHAVTAPRSTSGSSAVQAKEDPLSVARENAKKAETPGERQTAGIALIRELRAQALQQR